MLVYFCFLLILIAALKFKIGITFSQTILKATLIFGTAVVVITESLSFFHAINVIYIYGTWTLVALILSFFILRDRKDTISLSKIKTKRWTENYKSLFWYDKVLIWLMPILVFPLLYQGIIYPPNNWDSLTYHMSRIMYWIGNESVSHFPARISRLLYQPPFAEFMIMNINLINGNDYLSNSVQLFFLVMSAISCFAILETLKVPRSYGLLAAFLVLTIPSAELQATTAKNDIVCGFFLLSSLYFSIQFYSHKAGSTFIFLGISVGLTMLTKGTAFIYLTPILSILAVMVFLTIIKTRDFTPIYYGFAAVVIAVLLNFSHFCRNYEVDGSLISVDTYETKSISNDVMDRKFFISNLLKNAGLHLGGPFKKIADSTIRDIHKNLGVSIDDPRTNYIGYKYEGARSNTTHEDYIPNTTQFLLFNISFIIMLYYGFKDKRNRIYIFLATSIAIHIILFSLVLKWQPWHTRLQIPIFLFGTIFISLAAYNSKNFRYLLLCCIPIILYSFCFNFIYNDLRPIVVNEKYTKNIKLSDSRLKKYFSNQPLKYFEYSLVINKLYDINNLKKIGLVMSDWEYPLVRDLYYDHVKLLALNTMNPTSKIFQDTKGIRVIISDIENRSFIEYEGKRFLNQMPDNKYIWIYVE